MPLVTLLTGRGMQRRATVEHLVLTVAQLLVPLQFWSTAGTQMHRSRQKCHLLLRSAKAFCFEALDDGDNGSICRIRLSATYLLRCRDTVGQRTPEHKECVQRQTLLRGTPGNANQHTHSAFMAHPAPSR